MNPIFQQFDFVDILGVVIFPLFPLSCLFIVLLLIWQKKNPLTLASYKEVSWGLLEVVFLAATLLFAKIAAQGCAVWVIAQKHNLPLEKVDQELVLENASVFLGFGVVFSVAQLMFAIVFLRKVQQSSWSDLGIGWARLKKNIGIGLVAGLMLVPLVLILNVVLHSALGL
ncbi:MAG: hypothetical protein VX438_16970, partial [Planctomycetota bacterium]|nr:hypothetical protein [Planctomycetota bacterium]